MATRQALLESMLTPARLREVQQERTAFQEFTNRLAIGESPEALILYLTHLNSSDLTIKALLRKLSSLDLARRIDGHPEWRADPDVRRYLWGLHRDRPIGAPVEHSDPIYPEILQAMIDAIMLPRSDQLRDRAVILMANATPWPASTLARLRWRHIQFHSRRVEIQLPPPARPQHRYRDHLSIWARDDDLCVVDALQWLRRPIVCQDDFVFASRLGASHRGAIEHLVARLPHKAGPQYPVRFRTGGSPLRRILSTVTAPEPLQLRDRALLLISFGAALRGYEAIGLRQCHVTLSSEGLVLSVPGRRDLVGIPAHGQSKYCPSAAWRQWFKAVTAQAMLDPQGPAFLAGNFSVLWPLSMTQERLTGVVARAAREAQLTGHYTFTSLRIGFVRTSLRDGAANHAVAAHAGYRYLANVVRHERREQIVHTSVAGQLGL